MTDPDRVAAGETDHWVHPVVQAGIAHHRLAWIHPFLDGNGRTARMLTAMLLFQRGYDFKYLFDLSTYYESDRTKHYRALRTADSGDDYTPWLECFCGGLAMQMYSVQSLAKQGAAEQISGTTRPAGTAASESSVAIAHD